MSNDALVPQAFRYTVWLPGCWHGLVKAEAQATSQACAGPFYLTTKQILFVRHTW